MAWLIDGSGVCWPRQLHPINRWDTADDPVEYAVSELGFIHVRPSNCGLLLRFSPSRVGWRTMISALYLVADEKPKRVALWHGAGSADLEIFGTLAGAFRRLEELVDGHPRPVPALSRKRWSVDRAPKHIAEQIKAPLSAWHRAGRRLTPEALGILRTLIAPDDMLVVRNPCGTAALVYDHWGSSFDFLGPRWVRIARGKNVEEQPFPELGRSVALLLRRTLADGRPRVEDIDVALRTSERIILRRRYSRLLLPWREPGGDEYVTLFRFDRRTSTA